MRVFLTGASGFIGSAIVPLLLDAGHQVVGLARSDESAQRVVGMGAEAHRGDLQDLESLRGGADGAEAVMHLGFNHDFTDAASFVANTEQDRRAIGAMGEALTGSDRPLIITSGVGLGGGFPGEPATEDRYDAAHPNPRKATEEAGHALLDQGVDVRVVRLPQVHDRAKQGLVTYLIDLAREKGVSAYVGEGANRWSAAPVADVARLYALALEKGAKGERYHAVAEEGVAARDIAESLGRGLRVPTVSLDPEEAPAHFGWLAMFAGTDMRASSAWTRERLGWEPTGPGLLEDLDNGEFVVRG